jgi:hypothetical protein
MSTPATPHAKPVQLQVNNTGAWKTIVRFDAGDALATGYAQEAATMLKRVDARNQFRIATREGLPVVLMRLEDDLNWSPACP